MLGNLGNKAASEAARVLGKSEESAARTSFNRDFNVENFDEFGGNVESGKWIEIATFQVPASTEYAWGYGSAENPKNQGYLYVDLYNDASTPAELEGTIRFVQKSATGRESEVVADYDTTRLDASRSNQEQMVPFPEQVNHPLVSKDSYLAVEFNANSTDTVSGTNSDIIIPVTEYDLSQS